MFWLRLAALHISARSRRYSIFGEKKLVEKINYMHSNPVKKRLVSSLDQSP